MLERELKRLTEIKRKTEQRLADAPEGTLQIAKCGGSTQFYLHKPGGPHSGIYLPKSQIILAEKLAQKTYDKKVLKCVDRRYSQIRRILKDYDDEEIENLYLHEHTERQKLVVPVEPTYRQKLEEWISKPYQAKAFKEDSPIILSNKGLRVRSKSEKIMADYFDSVGLVYKYECPLYMNSYGYIYPDFTFLSPLTGQEIYWEHEGMMDNADYARSAVRKIETYETNGIFPGDRLILSFETTASVINMALVREMAERYLL